MKASRIPAHESAFLATGVDIDGKRHRLTPLSVTVPGTSERLQVMECTRADRDESFYFKTKVPKKRIVLHFTAGYLGSDIATLTTTGREVSTPFVVARDGRIYNLWTSAYWSYHLGPGSEGGNEAMSKSSVGIEICNIGWLTKKGDELHTPYSTAKSPDVYCTLADTTFYTRVPAFREHEYFATFTDAQYDSVIRLLRFLTAKYQIPRKFVSPAKRFGVVSGIASFSGITSHVNFRPSGKWDIGPAFDWDRVIAGVEAAQYPLVATPAPAAAPVRVGAGAAKGVDAEAEGEDPSGPKTTRPGAEERRAPEERVSAAQRIGRKLDAAPDRVDIRDWFYSPRLAALPDRIINIAEVPEVLDQGEEGACTGFALAAVINFLLKRQGVKRSVSRRMLYELARRYDEWPGEDYEGSSARGAMKGWVRHGVCSAKDWKDDEHGLDCFFKVPDPKKGLTVADLARGTPGGAYYRVSHRQVRDMHAALAETGVLYCTLMVHGGWSSTSDDKRSYRMADGKTIVLPVIAREGRADGGHAVAIVGYTEHGFVIQNSWGKDWGKGGFALLPYEDYLLHATDVWVMQLGVPVQADLWADGNADTTAGIQRARPIVSLDVIRPFVVDVGNNGRLSSSGDYWTTEGDVRRLVQETVVKATKTWKKRRVLLYLHGGLNEERAVAQRIIAFRDVLLKNEIYPIHIMWETGAVNSLNAMINDLFTDVDERASGVGDWMRRVREGLYEAKDRSLELTLSRPGTALWKEMKENARLASEHPDGKGAMQLIAQYSHELLAGLSKADRDRFEIHVVAHSAGAVFAGHALQHLAGLGETFKTLQLLAPAIRIDEFRRLFLPRLGDGCPPPIVYVLSDTGERDDEVGPYGRSLLYLVSNSFEGRRETPLLGMQRFLTELEDEGNGPLDPEIQALFAKPDERGLPRLVVAGVGYLGVKKGERVILSQSDSHGGFDNDPATLNSVLDRILGAPPSPAFTVRDLQY